MLADAFANYGPLLIIGGLVLVGACISFILAERRRAELQKFADALGFAFDPEGSFVEFEEFDPFDRGHSRSAKNFLTGVRDGVAWRIFDYRYVTGSGKNRRTHHYGVVVGESPLNFPRLALRGESFLDRFAGAIGFDDIDFESDEFSRAYHVKAEDRKFAYDLLHPQMMEYLLELPRYQWQFGGPYVLITRGSRFKPAEITAVMAAITGLYERVPGFVRQDLAHGA